MSFQAQLLIFEPRLENNPLELLTIRPIDRRRGKRGIASELLVHDNDGQHPRYGFPAVDQRSSAGLQGAVDLLDAVETGACPEDDADIGDVVVEEVVVEFRAFGSLVGDLDWPGVPGDIFGEGVEEGLVDVGGVDLDVLLLFEDEAGDGAGACTVVVDDGSGWDGGDEGEVVLGKLFGRPSAGGFVCGDLCSAAHQGFGLLGKHFLGECVRHGLGSGVVYLRGGGGGGF